MQAAQPIRKTIRSASAALAVFVLACGNGEKSAAPPSWSAAYDTIGDTIVVRTEGGRVWPSTARLVTDITIGEFEGGGPGEHKSPDGGLAVLPDGRVLLRDPGNARISVFAPDGEFLESWRIRGGFNTSQNLPVDTAGNSYLFLLMDYDVPFIVRLHIEHAGNTDPS